MCAALAKGVVARFLGGCRALGTCPRPTMLPSIPMIRWLSVPVRAALAMALSVAILWAPTFAVAASPVASANQQAPAGLRFSIELHDVDKGRRKPLQKLTRRALRSVESALWVRLDGRLHVDFVGNDAAFRKVLRAAGGRGGGEPWIDGLALLHDDRIIVRLGGGGLLRTSEVTRHEIAHIAVHALTKDRFVPRWYHEGVAMLVAGEATLDRLKEGVGASAFDLTENIDELEDGFGGHRLEVQRAYALAAGFVWFAVRRTGRGDALADLHRRMALGLDFGPAFTATFGLSPDGLFGLYAHYVGSASSKWWSLLSDTVIWSLIGVLSLIAMLLAWVRRPRFDKDEPMDLQAIAAVGDAALRSGVLWIPEPEFPVPPDDSPPPSEPAPTVQSVEPMPDDEADVCAPPPKIGKPTIH